MLAKMSASELAPDAIFVSYRRDDAAFAAGWLRERLRQGLAG